MTLRGQKSLFIHKNGSRKRSPVCLATKTAKNRAAENLQRKGVSITIARVETDQTRNLDADGMSAFALALIVVLLVLGYDSRYFFLVARKLQNKRPMARLHVRDMM